MTAARLCPNCSNSQIEDAGNCPACGFQAPSEAVPPETPEPPEHKAIAGLIEMDYSVAEDVKAEIPPWRVELSKRLQEIKNKRESAPAAAQATDPEGATLPSAPSAPQQLDGSRNGEAEPAPSRAQALPERKSRRMPRTPRPVPKLDAPRSEPPEQPLPLFRPSPPNPVVGKPPSGESQTPPAQADAIQDMIDRAVARQTSPSAAEDVRPVFQGSASLVSTAAAAPSRWVLLSRTLAGLVDLIITVFCTAAMIIAADAFAGVEILDAFSLVDYGALLVATFLIYSVFFLITANQTIGMMITDLRVVDEAEGRPEARQILLRCGFYLLSLAAAGLGLLWGCFDRQAKCLHDRLSGTKVVRLAIS